MYLDCKDTDQPVEFAQSPEPVECAVGVTECEGLVIYFINRNNNGSNNNI